MTDQLANAGTETAAPNPAPISGDKASVAQETATTPSEPRNPMKEAFAKAKEQLSGGEPPKTGANPGDAAAQAGGKPKPVGEGGQKETPVLEPLKAPERWEGAWKDAFGKQPRDVQEAWLNQHKAWEQGYNRKFEELAGERKFKEAVTQALTPTLRSHMAKQNMDEAAAATYALKQLDRFAQDPIGTIGALMRQRGIDPRVFLQGQGDQGQRSPSAEQIFAPIVRPLMAKIQELEQFKADFTTHQEAETAKANEATFAKFSDATDEAGSPLYPHLERVADRMADLLEHDPRFAAMDLREGLEEAYRIAVAADKDLLAELVSAEAAKRAEAMEQERLRTNLRAAAGARPSASTTTPAPTRTGLAGAFAKAKQQLGTR